MAPGETYPRSGGSGFGAVDRHSDNGKKLGDLRLPTIHPEPGEWMLTV
jgi:hypothetical protein